MCVCVYPIKWNGKTSSTMYNKQQDEQFSSGKMG